MKHDPKFKKAEAEFPLREEMRKRTVETPDGQTIEIDPLKDYFCDAAPTVHPRP